MKRGKRIRQVSPKNAARKIIRRDLVARILEQHPRCQMCNAAASVDVHEVLPRGRGGDELDPTITLAVCRTCHDRAHADPKTHLRSGTHATIEDHERRSSMVNRQLSDQHWQVLAWIGDFTSENGHGPLVTEILDGVADSWCHKILGDLCARSLLEADKKRIGALRRVVRR